MSTINLQIDSVTHLLNQRIPELGYIIQVFNQTNTQIEIKYKIRCYDRNDMTRVCHIIIDKFMNLDDIPYKNTLLCVESLSTVYDQIYGHMYCKIIIQIQ